MPPKKKRGRATDNEDGNLEKHRRVGETVNSAGVGIEGSAEDIVSLGIQQTQTTALTRWHFVSSRISSLWKSVTGTNTNAMAARRVCRNRTTVTLALVELMREIFMEAMRDGEISDTERELLLQIAVVYSQVSNKAGKEYVSLASDEVDQIEKSFPEISEFMDEVSKGIKAHFLGLKDKGMRRSRQEDRSLVMSSLRVALDQTIQVRSDWQINAKELIALCEKDALVADSGSWTTYLWFGGILGWSGLFWWAIAACGDLVKWCMSIEQNQWIERLYILLTWSSVALQSLMLVCVFIGWLCWNDQLIWLAQLLPDKFMMRERVWEMYIHRSWKQPFLVFDAMRFFTLCFTYSSIKSWCDVIMVVLQIRVVMCFFSQLPIIGGVAYPLCYMVEHFMGWNRDHPVLGCLNNTHIETVGNRIPGLAITANFVGTSIIEFLSILARFTTGVDWSFKAILLACSDDLLKNINIRIVWALKVFLDFLISAGMCEVYQDVAKNANRVVQPNLMLRSLKLGTKIREAK